MKMSVESDKTDKNIGRKRTEVNASELSEEEKMAIKILKNMNDGYTFQLCRTCIADNKYNEKNGICESTTCEYLNSINIVLSLIDRLQKEVENFNYYKARFENYNKCFDRLVKELLGKDYYNNACDTYTCDRLIVEDLIYLYKPLKRKWWQFWKRKLF